MKAIFGKFFEAITDEECRLVGNGETKSVEWHLRLAEYPDIIEDLTEFVTRHENEEVEVEWSGSQVLLADGSWFCTNVARWNVGEYRFEYQIPLGFNDIEEILVKAGVLPEDWFEKDY